MMNGECAVVKWCDVRWWAMVVPGAVRWRQRATNAAGGIAAGGWQQCDGVM